jgi:sugar/nucleoside kinase (ribokinase family)
MNRYRAMIGVGGIGAGTFFAVSGNATIGREESRGGHFLHRRDYCKLHIISHYVKALAGPEFAVVPVGKVGDDDVGRRLLDEMGDVGLDLRYVETSPGNSTLFSFCFVYPDGSGGNLTTDDSACSKVDPEFVARAQGEFERFRGAGIALAAPEVPLPAREALIRMGTRYGFFRAASFTSEEIPWAVESGILQEVDLLAINRDEAGAVLGGESAGDLGKVVSDALAKLREMNSKLMVTVTAGAGGSWSWDGSELRHVPACKVEPVSTAGAGDAHLAGVLVGLAEGMPLAEAHRLGASVAGMSVTSPHTIDKRIDRESLGN